MRRLGQFVMAALLVTTWGASPASAQATARKWSAQVDGAATLGHSSSSEIGGELDYRWKTSWDIAFEFGHIGNITSSDLQAGATNFVTEAIAVGYFPANTTANPVQHATYYDLGVRYHLMPDGNWNPYVAVGVGASRINTETGFSAPPATPLQLGLDLDGYVTKAFFMLGVGANHSLNDRLFLDGSLRYSRVLARTGTIENDKGVNIIRVQVGAGIRF